MAPRGAPDRQHRRRRRRRRAAEDGWNSRDPERVCLAYTPDSQWRNRDEVFEGREAIKAFLRRKWAAELDYRLTKWLFCHDGHRIAVHFQYEFHDASGQWYRAYGNEASASPSSVPREDESHDISAGHLATKVQHWEFDDEGLMKKRDMSANNVPITFAERRIKVDQAPILTQ
eukprot:SM000013S26380  [mRNA]  locus=s13:176024:176838:+ [translate_table: standard]